MSTRQVTITLAFGNPEIKIPIDITNCDKTTTKKEVIRLAKIQLMSWVENAIFEVD